jgi:lipid A disaccharide synthetase
MPPPPRKLLDPRLDDRVWAVWAGKRVTGTVIGIDSAEFTLLLRNQVKLKVPQRDIVRITSRAD